MPIRTPDAAVKVMPDVYAELPRTCQRALVKRLHGRSGRSSWRQLLGLSEREAVALLDELGLDHRPPRGQR
jgi:hypothetical protein